MVCRRTVLTLVEMQGDHRLTGVSGSRIHSAVPKPSLWSDRCDFEGSRGEGCVAVGAARGERGWREKATSSGCSVMRERSKLADQVTRTLAGPVPLL